MATKPSEPSKPTKSRDGFAQDERLRKSIPASGGRVLGQNEKATTVFQTRPTPPDPKKK